MDRLDKYIHSRWCLCIQFYLFLYSLLFKTYPHSLILTQIYWKGLLSNSVNKIKSSSNIVVLTSLTVSCNYGSRLIFLCQQKLDNGQWQVRGNLNGPTWAVLAPAGAPALSEERASAPTAAT